MASIDESAGSDAGEQSWIALHGVAQWELGLWHAVWLSYHQMEFITNNLVAQVNCSSTAEVNFQRFRCTHVFATRQQDKITFLHWGCHPGSMFFSNRSVKQRQDILTNKLAANTLVIARKTQIAQCAAVTNWGDTWNMYAGGQLCFSCLATWVTFCL